MHIFRLKDFGVERQVGKLANGVRLLNFKWEGFPIDIAFVSRSGARFDPKGKEGLAHFTEHMVFEGTKRFKKAAEIDIQIEGAGGRTASHTSYEETYHRFSIADIEDLIMVRELAYEIFNRPLFLKDKIVKEKKTISAEISDDLQDPGFLVREGLRGLMFGDSAFSVPIAGTLESIQNLDRRDISSFCKNNLPNEMLVVSCGGVDIKELADAFNDVIPFKPDIGYAPIKAAVAGKTGITRKKENIHSINVRIGFP